MKQITRRTLHRWSKTVGDRHDPTSQLTLMVSERRNGHNRTVKAVMDFGCRIYLNNHEQRPPSFFGKRGVPFDQVAKLQDEWFEARFLKLTGMTTKQFEKAYDRVHPWFADPMGSPSMYE